MMALTETPKCRIVEKLVKVRKRTFHDGSECQSAMIPMTEFEKSNEDFHKFKNQQKKKSITDSETAQLASKLRIQNKCRYEEDNPLALSSSNRQSLMVDPTKSICSNHTFRTSSPRVMLQESQSSIAYQTIRASVQFDEGSNISGIQKSRIYKRTNITDDEVKYEDPEDAPSTKSYNKKIENKSNKAVRSEVSTPSIQSQPQNNAESKPKRYRRNRNMRHNIENIALEIKNIIKVEQNKFPDS